MGTSRRVLIIDDEPEIRALMRELMLHWGFEVDVADSAPRGIELFHSSPYALVLTDLSMPAMSGWAVVDAVRRAGRQTEVVMITGSATLAEQERAREMGVPMLQKPVRFRDLQRVVDRVLVDSRL